MLKKLIFLALLFPIITNAASEPVCPSIDSISAFSTPVEQMNDDR